MNWFKLLKEQRQVARNIQSFKPIQFDKPIKLNKPEETCEEKFIKRAKAAASAVGFDSFDPSSKSRQSFENEIKIDEGEIWVRFVYYNNPDKLTDDSYCWMMENYDKLNMQYELSAEKQSRGPFFSLPRKDKRIRYYEDDDPDTFVRHEMNIWKNTPFEAMLSVDFNFLGRIEMYHYKKIKIEETDRLIKEHIPNWSGSL